METTAANVQPKTYQCPECDRSFLRVSLLKSHLKDFHYNGLDVCVLDLSYLCEICLFCCGSKAELRKHYKTHASDLLQEMPPDFFQCPECDKTFFSEKTLKSHQYLHRRCKNSPHPCSVCGKQFSEKRLLDEHVERFHSSKSCKKLKVGPTEESTDQAGSSFTLFACKECKGFFYDSKELEKHSLIHAPKKPFQCKVCDASFISNEALTKHTETHQHSQPEPEASTSTSDISFILPSLAKEKEFKCDICNKGFETKIKLNIHLHTHTTDMPFRCKICLKAFSHESHLRSHYIRCVEKDNNPPDLIEIETQTLPHPITLFQPRDDQPILIDDRFIRASPKVTASGKVKPYQCDMCSRCFGLKANLLVHKQNHVKKFAEKPAHEVTIESM